MHNHCRMPCLVAAIVKPLRDSFAALPPVGDKVQATRRGARTAASKLAAMG